MKKVIAYDCEFDDNGVTIDLISIGMVDLAGKTLYRCSTEFDPQTCNEWLQKNVLPYLPSRTSLVWADRATIKQDILDFVGTDDPVWWVFSGAYDHVALCQLFGPMVKLPKGWPYFSNDLSQYWRYLGKPELPKQSSQKHDALQDALHNRDVYLFLKGVEEVQRRLNS